MCGTVGEPHSITAGRKSLVQENRKTTKDRKPDMVGWPTRYEISMKDV
jgi:hypothetical protein